MRWWRLWVFATPALAQTELTVPGGSTTGTYMDYMKTVYARASGSELLQVPLTSFDNEYQLTGARARKAGSSPRTG